MTLSVIAKDEKIKFESIVSVYAERFVEQALESYRDYASEVEVPELPVLFFYGDQEFVDNFCDLFSIFRASIRELEFPYFDWDTATDEEQDEVDDQLSMISLEYEDELLEDIGKVLDRYQLFHVTTDEVSLCGRIVQTVEHYNSPLQEVW